MNFVARERSLHALVRGVTFLLLLLDEKTCQRDAEDMPKGLFGEHGLGIRFFCSFL